MDLTNKLPNHKLQIARTFNRAATYYSEASFLEKELGSRLLDRLDFIKFNPIRILDLGGGTGFFSKQLSDRYPGSLIYNLDFAERLLNQSEPCSQIHRLCADANRLPLKAKSVDFVFSNAVVHWIEDLKTLFLEIQRVLKPGGLFLFSTFGPDTLQELRKSFLAVDQESHVNYFLDMHLIGDALLGAGFYDPVMDRESLTFTYATTTQLLKDLKSSGSSYTLRESPRSFFRKTLFQEMSEAYEKFRNESGALPATVETLYGHAWVHPEPDLYHVPICRT